jgi:hypothetical protein
MAAFKTKIESPSFRSPLDGLREAPTGSPLARTSDRGSGQSPTCPRGRMIFGLDATASRSATWHIACKVQADMFRAAAPIGALDVQLVYYRGDECRASGWKSSDEEIARLMNKIDCVGGATQIGRVLAHALRETEKAPVQALVFIGDAMEEEISELATAAGELGAKGVPIFTYQEGRDAGVRKAFRLLALRSGGKYFEFNTKTPQAIERLSQQLNAVARLTVGDVGAIKLLGRGKPVVARQDA